MTAAGPSRPLVGRGAERTAPPLLVFIEKSKSPPHQIIDLQTTCLSESISWAPHRLVIRALGEVCRVGGGPD